jgi:predicted amidohydrolase YtcJ
MTHLYTLLVGGNVLARADAPPATAIAWAHDTVLAIGRDEDVAAISRGDSRLVDLAGATVLPLGPSGDLRWPPAGVLEVGGPADLAVLDEDPRSRTSPAALEPSALVRSGRVVAGRLPGAAPDDEAHDHH